MFTWEIALLLIRIIWFDFMKENTTKSNDRILFPNFFFRFCMYSNKTVRWYSCIAYRLVNDSPLFRNQFFINTYRRQSNVHLKRMKFVIVLIEKYLWNLICLYYISLIFYVQQQRTFNKSIENYKIKNYHIFL